MARQSFKDITIVGVGLLGGSLGLAVKAQDPSVRIVGVGHRQSSLDEALRIGAVDAVTTDVADGVANASLVVLCTPVGLFKPLIEKMLPALRPAAVVTDVGSTKADVVAEADVLLAGHAAFVGAHPIAGSEQRGATFARTDLYTDKLCILTPTKQTSSTALRKVASFWRSVGMRTVQLAPALHDRALARISHLPHLLAALLVAVPDAKELDWAGTGFIDATRIAGGDPLMWRDIFLTNCGAITEAIDGVQALLDQTRALLAAGDGESLQKLFADSQRRRTKMLEKRLRQKRVEG